MKYIFTVTEALQKEIEIEATNHIEAYKIGRRKYSDAEIVLTHCDFVGVDFTVSDPVDDNE